MKELIIFIIHFKTFIIIKLITLHIKENICIEYIFKLLFYIVRCIYIIVFKYFKEFHVIYLR